LASRHRSRRADQRIVPRRSRSKRGIVPAALAQLLHYPHLMTSSRQARQASHGPSTIVRWEFVRGRQHVACQVDRAGPLFQVAVVPYHDLQRASIETFWLAMDALSRHASLAARLRTLGWKLVAYTTSA
jgi:hypothetical protein